VTASTPERLYDQQWAFTVLEHALLRLGKEYAEAGRQAQFEQWKAFLTSRVEYGQSAAVAEATGVSKAGLSLAVHRMRRRYRELVRGEIAHTVSNPAELEEEMRYLLEVIRGAN
jgi:RNA polymerase sigma-70 factor (ECF subfamily)